MNRQEAYKILNIKEDSSEKEINSAYRKIAKKLHPDVNKEPEAEEKFKQVNVAYELLTKQPKRFNPFETFFGGFTFDFNTFSTDKTTLTLEIDNAVDADKIIKILKDNKINIKSYNLTQRS